MLKLIYITKNRFKKNAKKIKILFNKSVIFYHIILIVNGHHFYHIVLMVNGHHFYHIILMVNGHHFYYIVLMINGHN